MLQTLKTTNGRIAALATAPFAWALSHTMALAQNADVTGALQTNQDGLTEASTSTFTGAGVQTAAQNTTNAILFVLGAVGIAMAAWGIYKLWKISNEGEQARDSAVGPIMMIAIGGMMTIAAVVTAIFPQLFLA